MGLLRASHIVLCADEKTVDAVIYNVSVIGGAVRRVPAELEVHNSNIPWLEMRGMCNAVVHQYLSVDTQILWETVFRKLPPLTPLRRFTNTKSD
jgi:uncharacterized protein with HEPN domain